MQSHLLGYDVAKKVITLCYNLAHQKAIYQGLSYAAGLPAARYIVIDSDGKDDSGAIKSIFL